EAVRTAVGATSHETNHAEMEHALQKAHKERHVAGFGDFANFIYEYQGDLAGETGQNGVWSERKAFDFVWDYMIHSGFYKRLHKTIWNRESAEGQKIVHFLARLIDTKKIGIDPEHATIDDIVRFKDMLDKGKVTLSTTKEALPPEP